MLVGLLQKNLTLINNMNFSYSLYVNDEMKYEMNHSGAQAHEARQRNTMGKKFREIYPCEKFWL